MVPGFQQGEAGWFASGSPSLRANTVPSAGPELELRQSGLKIAGHFHASGVPCSWLCLACQQNS